MSLLLNTTGYFEATDVSGPCIVVGVDGPDAYIVLDDGHITKLPLQMVTVDLRYNWHTHQWVDVGDIGGEETTPDDGRESLSGEVPDVDGAGDGDPVDEER